MSDASLPAITDTDNITESENPTLPTSEGAPVNNVDFATEVREDRLNLLWRVVLGIAFALLWVAFLRRTSNGLTIAQAALTLTVGALLAGRLLRREMFNAAVWSLVGSAIIAATIPMETGNETTMRLMPFLFPVFIFTIGVLLPPLHTFVALGITVTITLIAPSLAVDAFYFGYYQVAAITVAVMSALLAAQVTGELYQITEWSLENYKRERSTAIDLFENRQQLERSLRRSEVLGEKLQEINGELESAKHFRGQFLANMSHELRTPLNAIIGFSETMLSFPMMYDDVELPQAYRNDLNQIYNSGQQLLAVINDILDLSKVDAGKLEVQPERVRIDTLIDNVMMTAAGLVGNKPIELRRNVARSVPDVYADESRLRQVLINLYSNSAKFTDRGSITVSTQVMGDNLQISVTDTGEGIREESLESIFDEFSQVESKGRDPRSGAGLGLTISRKLMTLMDGRIRAESVYGEGATFHVLVPVYDAELHAEPIHDRTMTGVEQS
ncbi:MAG: ATP-binding protein [Chloroflexota bacterium]